MKIKIKTFGKIAELISTAELEVKDVSDTEQLREWMEMQFPGLKNMNYQVAIDRTVVQGNRVLEEKMEVALLPPFSGG